MVINDRNGPKHVLLSIEAYRELLARPGTAQSANSPRGGAIPQPVDDSGRGHDLD